MPQGGGVGGKRNESSRSWPRRYGLCATVWRPLRTGTVSVHAQFAETWWARRGSNPHAAYAATTGMLYPAPRGERCRIGTVSVRVEPRPPARRRLRPVQFGRRTRKGPSDDEDPSIGEQRGGLIEPGGGHRPGGRERAGHRVVELG